MAGCKIKVVRINAPTGEFCGDDVVDENGRCDFHSLLSLGVCARSKRRGPQYTLAFSRLALAAESQFNRMKRS